MDSVTADSPVGGSSLAVSISHPTILWITSGCLAVQGWAFDATVKSGFLGDPDRYTLWVTYVLNTINRVCVYLIFCVTFENCEELIESACKLQLQHFAATQCILVGFTVALVLLIMLVPE